jgi:hypothetical protein
MDQIIKKYVIFSKHQTEENITSLLISSNISVNTVFCIQNLFLKNFFLKNYYWTNFEPTYFMP